MKGHPEGPCVGTVQYHDCGGHTKLTCHKMTASKQEYDQYIVTIHVLVVNILYYNFAKSCCWEKVGKGKWISYFYNNFESVVIAK